MRLPERMYFRLTELAERWNQEEDYLLNLAAQGFLRMTCSKYVTFTDYEDVDGEICTDPSELDIFSTKENKVECPTGKTLDNAEDYIKTIR